jgi:hypothetical protein
VELPGSRQSPAPWPIETHPEPGSLPSPPVLLSGGSKRYCGPLRPPALLPPECKVRTATPRSTGSPALRRALCRRATPTTPVSDPALMGRLLLRDPAAFPVRMAGRRSQRPFRGLLGLHSRCGPSTRRPTHGGPWSRELQRFGYPPRCLGSYRGVPTTPRAGLSPASDTAPQRGAHSNPCFGRDRPRSPSFRRVSLCLVPNRTGLRLARGGVGHLAVHLTPDVGGDK